MARKSRVSSPGQPADLLLVQLLLVLERKGLLSPDDTGEVFSGAWHVAGNDPDAQNIIGILGRLLAAIRERSHR